MDNPDLSTVTDEQLCNTADLSGNPLMWELAERFRQASPIASAAREAGMVDEQGKFRKILGTLPVTADGCAMGSLATVYCDCGGGFIGECDTGAAVAWLKSANGEESIVPCDECYSTESAARSAAEAAKPQLCHPFSTGTCDRPECGCREEIGRASCRERVSSPV